MRRRQNPSHCEYAEGKFVALSERHTPTIRRIVLKKGIPSDWFTLDDRYGWKITLRILIPFLLMFPAIPLLAEYATPWVIIPAAVLMGIYGYKISFIMHDCAHDSLFNSKRLNLWVGRVCGWLVVTNYDVFKRLHTFHHRFNGGAGDPQRFEAEGFAGASRSRLYKHIFLPLIGTRAVDFLRGYADAQFRAAPGEEVIVAEQVVEVAKSSRKLWLAGMVAAQLILVSVVTAVGSNLWLVVVYPISAATVALFLARFRTFAEHIKPDGKEAGDFARSHHPRFVDAFFLYDAHFNYHVEHHLFPQIPSCNLSKIFESYRDEIHCEESLGRSMISTVMRRLREVEECR